MKKQITKFLAFGIVVVLSACAASYKPIKPPTVSYNSHDLQDGVEFSYKYDVLRESGNNKYAKKETKKGIKLVAVKITNNTVSELIIGRDIAFYSGQSQIFPMEPLVIKQSIKQIVPGYLFYLLLTPVNLTVTKTSSNGHNDTEMYPVGLGLGPAITFGNMLVAGSANKNMLNELMEFNILNRDIQPGETVYGIIGIRDMGYVPLTIKMLKSTSNN